MLVRPLPHCQVAGKEAHASFFAKTIKSFGKENGVRPCGPSPGSSVRYYSMPALERIRSAITNAKSWYKKDTKNRIILWEVLAILVVSVIGVGYYFENRLLEEDVTASNVPDIYVSPVRYSLAGSNGNVYIYDLESRIINRSSVAITTTHNLLIALTDDEKTITEEYGESIHLYPIFITPEIIYQDAQVGFKLAYSPSEMTSGTVETIHGEYNAYQLTTQGDVLYDLNAEYVPDTESVVSRSDGYAHVDNAEFRLVLSCPSEEIRNGFLDSLFISVETAGSYDANTGHIYSVPEDQTITEQSVF